MFHLDSSMRYWLYPYPTDMRKGFYTLSGIVTNSMGRNVLDGDVFIFINRGCNSMKILHLESGGLVIYHLRLDSGRFKLPVFDENTCSFSASWQQLMILTQSSSLPCRKKEKKISCFN